MERVIPEYAAALNWGLVSITEIIISLRQAQILILEILQCIPVVKIFAFLDLEQNCLFMDGH